MTSELEDQQRVLSEVSHDLANRFHRSYYFLELLGDALDPGDSNALSLLHRLRGTVEDIELMARGALELVRPIELRTMHVRVEDLTTSLRQHVGMRSVELRGDLTVGLSEVAVDPARISSALACLCKAAIGSDDSQAAVIVELSGGAFVDLRIHRAPAAEKPTMANLQLALSARIARLHGGAIDLEDGDAWSLTLRLPVAQQGM